jgi:hypothetical protein
VNLDKIKAYADKLNEQDPFIGRKIIANVAGVTFDDRQDVLAKVIKSTPISLRRDRRNQYDFYAIEVLAEVDGVWKQVGFLPRKMAENIAKRIDRGVVYSASVHSLLGGGESKFDGRPLSYGVDIAIISD